MTALKQNNTIIYKRGIWKSFAMMLFLFVFVGITLLLGLGAWYDGATWNKILSITISYAKVSFIVGFILFFYAINSITFYKSYIVVFHPFLFWRRKVNYSDIIFAEFIWVSRASDAIKLYKKNRKMVSIEIVNDHMKILKLLNANNIPLVITEKNITNSGLRKKLEKAEIVYSNKKLH